MVTILQLLTSALVFVSFLLLVAVPVALASPGDWEKSKGFIFQGAGLWSGLVLVTGLFNAFA